MSRENVAVIGAGSWGTTLAKILAENGHQVLLWGRRKEICDELNETRENSRYLPGFKLPVRVSASDELDRCCDVCRLVFLAVPSHGFRAVAHALGEHVSGEHVLVHCTKGLEQDTFKRMSEILREETPSRRIGVLAGPNLSAELARQRPAGTLVASRYEEVYRRVQAALHNRYFRVYSGRDVIGAEIGSVFKNVVALATGAVDALEMGDNTKALLMTRGLNEMARLGAAMGAQVITFGGMAGIGDLVATCASQFSRNRQVGMKLASGQKIDAILAEMHMVAEGVGAAKAVHAFAQRQSLHLPIARAVYRVIYEGADVGEVMRDLMAIETGGEFAGLEL